MNVTVARLTVRTLLGRRRAVLFLLLPAALVGLCVLARLLAGLEEIEREAGFAAGLLGGFGLGTLLPLLGLLGGTGAIGPEIDDGSIVYLMSKPLNRSSIVLTKLAVAVVVVTVLGAVPVLLSGFLVTGELGGLASAFAVGALVAGLAYCAVFLLLAVVTRNAVVIGLMYALVWETLVGSIVPGAQELSVQQWSLAVTERLLGDDAAQHQVDAAVEPLTGAILLALVTVGCTWYAGRRLRRLRLAGGET
jgi:ABC-2 type transport system permease protein